MVGDARAVGGRALVHVVVEVHVAEVEQPRLQPGRDHDVVERLQVAVELVRVGLARGRVEPQVRGAARPGAPRPAAWRTRSRSSHRRRARRGPAACSSAVRSRTYFASSVRHTVSCDCDAQWLLVSMAVNDRSPLRRSKRVKSTVDTVAPGAGHRRSSSPRARRVLADQPAVAGYAVLDQEAGRDPRPSLLVVM